MIHWLPDLGRPPPAAMAQPERAGLFCWARRYNATMRIRASILSAGFPLSSYRPQQGPVENGSRANRNYQAAQATEEHLIATSVEKQKIEH
jgi:hypothetical protein